MITLVRFILIIKRSFFFFSGSVGRLIEDLIGGLTGRVIEDLIGGLTDALLIIGSNRVSLVRGVYGSSVTLDVIYGTNSSTSLGALGSDGRAIAS